jgi:hypothetical protein
VKVRVLEHVNVLPSTNVHVAEVAGVVKTFLLTDVAVATPRTGVTNVGEVALTVLPVPVNVYVIVLTSLSQSASTVVPATKVVVAISVL